MSDDQLSDQDQGCKIQNKIQDPCKPTDTSPDSICPDSRSWRNKEFSPLCGTPSARARGCLFSNTTRSNCSRHQSEFWSSSQGLLITLWHANFIPSISTRLHLTPPLESSGRLVPNSPPKRIQNALGRRHMY
jgi:hypothetical protein